MEYRHNIDRQTLGVRKSFEQEEYLYFLYTRNKVERKEYKGNVEGMKHILRKISTNNGVGVKIDKEKKKNGSNGQKK